MLVNAYRLKNQNVHQYAIFWWKLRSQTDLYWYVPLDGNVV